MPTTLASLHEVAAAARPVVERVVWCTVTTVAADGTPRSRLMHPVWCWDGDAPTAPAGGVRSGDGVARRPDRPDCGILRFTAHRVIATPARQPGLRWQVAR